MIYIYIYILIFIFLCLFKFEILMENCVYIIEAKDDQVVCTITIHCQDQGSNPFELYFDILVDYDII